MLHRGGLNRSSRESVAFQTSSQKQTAESSSYTPQHGSGSEGKVTDLDSCMQVSEPKTIVHE